MASLNYQRKPRTLEGQSVPAPLGGMNAADSLAAIPPNQSIYNYNLMPSEYGLRVRKGWQDHMTGIPGGSGVRTIVGYQSETSLINDRLFAMTRTGIFDVSLTGNAPTPMFTWPAQTANAGYGNFSHFVNDAGADLLLFADEANGLHRYTPGINTWTLEVGITGPNETDIAFIVNHKERLWLIERDSSDAWYLPAGSVTGAATKFAFGNKFLSGGHLVGLYNWTLDAGNGMDDYLVAISSGGDVVVYEGVDPATAATWQIRGIWSIGKVPAGRRIAAQLGGQLYVLSAFGVISLSALLQGYDVVGAVNAGPARNIARLVRDVMVNSINSYGWEMDFFASDGFMQIITPVGSTQRAIQFVMNLTSAGWGIWRDIPLQTSREWRGAYYFGTQDGRVAIYDGVLDAVTIGNTGGVPINFSFLSAFSPLGGPEFVRTSFIRTYWITQGAIPIYTSTTKFDFDLSEVLNTTPTLFAVNGAWDASNWDSTYWSGFDTSQVPQRGTWGLGRNVAIAVAGQASSRATLVSWELLYDKGGLM